MLRSRLTLMSILAALHLLLGATLIPALPLDHSGRLLAVAFLVLSWLLLPLGLRSRSLPRPLAWVALLWMGTFSGFLVLGLARALVLGVLALFAVELPREWLTGSAWAVLAGTLLMALAGVLNARRAPRIKRVELKLPGLPRGLDGLRIVQLSDVHVGPTIRHGWIDRVVQRCNALNPDLTVLTGDLLDGSVEQLREQIAPLGQLRARHGVYAVLGNHEYYSGAPAWIVEWRRMGLTVLLNEHRLIEHNDAQLALAGVTDYSAGVYDPAQRSDPAAARRGAPDDAYPLLLAHQPRSAGAAVEAGFRLQLSGHTHGGQFWPWMHFVRFQQPWVAGIHWLGDLCVYISRGTGYWGPPLRLGAPSEITLLTLRSA